MKESLINLRIVAGVPITSIKENVELTPISDRSLNKILKQLISDFDVEAAQSKNREDKTTYNNYASDMEDVLLMVKGGKKAKASKLFKELSPKAKKFITSKIDKSKVAEFNEYFNVIIESDMEYNDMEVNQDSPVLPEDIQVTCPYCTCNSEVYKNEFYDHVMDNHVEIESDPEEITIDGEIVSDVEMTMESSEDATVWDKTNDKDESPTPYVNDADKISLPKEIKTSLEKEIKELQDSAQEIYVSDYKTAQFQNNVANSMIDVLYHLKHETESGMKMAQITLLKFMSPIVQKFPKDVYDFIMHGGYDTKKNTSNSLISLFKNLK